MKASAAKRVALENVNRPGERRLVEATLYDAMKRAILRTLPKAPRGLTADELRARVLPHLPDDLFPGGAKAGWWTKAVQLDLAAKGVIKRDRSKPLRLRRV